MPEPFRLFAPAPPITEKVVLTHSQDLFLALPAGLVQEVLLTASIRAEGKNAVADFQGQTIPVILGQRACPRSGIMPLVVFKTDQLTTNFLGIACSEIPQLAAITDPEWTDSKNLPRPWKSDRKGIMKGNKLFCRVSGINFDR